MYVSIGRTLEKTSEALSLEHVLNLSYEHLELIQHSSAENFYQNTTVDASTVYRYRNLYNAEVVNEMPRSSSELWSHSSFFLLDFGKNHRKHAFGILFEGISCLWANFFYQQFWLSFYLDVVHCNSNLMKNIHDVN